MNTSDADARKAKVTDEHRAEAARLRQIWEDRKPELKRRGVGTQLQFGLKFGVGSQAAVGFFLNGQTPLSLKAALGFAEGLGCTVADFSPRLASVLVPASTRAGKPAVVVAEGPSDVPLVRALLGVARALADAPERKRKLIAAAAASMIENGPNEDEAAAIDALAKGLPQIAATPAPSARQQDDWEDTVRSMAANWTPGPERDFLLGFLAAVDEAHRMKEELHERNAGAHSSTSRERARAG